MVIRRGDIWWAALPDAIGSAPGYRRPILVIQSDAFNQSNIQTVIAIALTSNLKLANAPGNLFLPASQSGLPRDSVINVSQIITLDKQFLDERVGKLSGTIMQQVKESLTLVLSL